VTDREVASGPSPHPALARTLHPLPNRNLAPNLDPNPRGRADERGIEDEDEDENE
jgi:hypothetical protein